MAYTDSLFQLGMDLTRSSTAQKEDHGQSALGAHDDRKDYFIERDGRRYAGTHLIIDLFGAKRLDDLKHIKETLKRCVEVAGATLLHIHLHHFTPNGGVSGVAVLAESHISIHSWPEVGYAALDVFMCGDAKPHATVDVLKAAFKPDRTVVKEHLRARHAGRAHLGDRRPKKAPVRCAKPRRSGQLSAGSSIGTVGRARLRCDGARAICVALRVRSWGGCP